MLVGELTLLLDITALSVTSIGTGKPTLVLAASTVLKTGETFASNVAVTPKKTVNS